MSDTLIIGDLHGKIEIAEAALESGYNCIFMGDYVDSFDRAVEDQIRLIRLILGAIESDPKRYQGLIGNHELSYLDYKMRASGYKYHTSTYMEHLRTRIEKNLKPYIWHNQFLLSHAGISKELLSIQDIELDDYLKTGDYNQIGYVRGGSYPCGGLFWCDWFDEFEPLNNQPQIVGHSGYRPPGEYKGILEKDGSYNVDCLDHKQEFLLLRGDGSVEVLYNLDKNSTILEYDNQIEIIEGRSNETKR